MNYVTFKFGLLLNFRDVMVTVSQNVLIFVSNTSHWQSIGLVHFIINDWNYLVFWKKALNQVLRFLNVSVYI